MVRARERTRTRTGAAVVGWAVGDEWRGEERSLGWRGGKEGCQIDRANECGAVQCACKNGAALPKVR